MVFSIFKTNKKENEFTFVGQTPKVGLAEISDITKETTGQNATHIKGGEMPAATTKDFHVDFIPKDLCKEILVNSKPK